MALLLIQRSRNHRTIANVHLTLRLLLPRKTVLHPFLVVAVGVVLAGMCTTRLLAVRRRFGGLHGASEEIAKLEGLDEVAVPDHAAVFGANLAELLVDFVDAVKLC